MAKQRCPLMAHYYRSKSVDFPVIGSLLLIHPLDEPSPILLTFQIARVGTQHYVDVNDLYKTDDLDLPRVLVGIM